MPKTGGYYQSIFPGNVHLFASQSPERISDIPSEKISSQDLAQQFNSACFVVSVVCSVFIARLCFPVTSTATPLPLFITCLLRSHNPLSFLSSSLGEKKSQYEFMKQCMNKSFPPLNTPLSKWSRDFSRTIYITVADTGFKFSCQSQDGILNHPIFLNEVREF